MSNLCEKCEMAIIAGTIMESPELVKHLETCDVCRDFAEFHRTMLETPLPVMEPSVAFSTLRRKARRQDLLYRRRLKLMAWPLSIAAAGLLAVTGFVMGLRTSATPVAPEVPVMATVNWSLSDSELEAMLAGETVQLAWDNVSNAKRCLNSMSAARDGGADWNIETFDLSYEGLQ